jgi:quercetin dioxygenase-like cupin family protein
MSSTMTEKQRERWLRDPIVPLDAPHCDDRGDIQPLVDEDMRSAVMISSRAGSVRANHYHKTDWHYCYVLSGSIEYFHRPHGSDDPPACVEIQAGQLFFTPPMVDHAMRFPKDTVFLTLGGNPRDQASYEADVVRIRLVDP